MRKYKCHKEVMAAKITEIQGITPESDKPRLYFETMTAIEKDIDWFIKHTPQVGGYLVEYEDGYQSYSPAEAFESGYTLIEDEEEEPDVPAHIQEYVRHAIESELDRLGPL